MTRDQFLDLKPGTKVVRFPDGISDSPMAEPYFGYVVSEPTPGVFLICFDGGESQYVGVHYRIYDGVPHVQDYHVDFRGKIWFDHDHLYLYSGNPYFDDWWTIE